MAWVGRDIKAHSVPIPSHTGLPPTRPWGLQCLKGWGIKTPHSNAQKEIIKRNSDLFISNVIHLTYM